MDDRIQAGVSTGIITADQAKALRALPVDSGPQRYGETQPGDEPFSLVRGFRDVFLTLGIFVLAAGLGGLALELTGMRFDAVFGWDDVAAASLLAATAWIVAEWVTARLRMPLASLGLAIAFSLAATAMLVAVFMVTDTVPLDVVELNTLVPALVGLSGLAFYVRFRLPSALLIVAGGFALNVYQIIDSAMWGEPNALALRLFAGGTGLVLFLGALVYELKDRRRQTRLSENAFWLHLVGAPMIVFALTGGVSSLDVNSSGHAAVLMITIVLLGLVALLIDRRAFIVAGLLYLASAIAYAIGQSGLSTNLQSIAIAIALGLFVVGLALGWQPLRRLFLNALPSSLSNYLPNPSNPHALGN